jgi:HEAT repeat protein
VPLIRKPPPGASGGEEPTAVDAAAVLEALARGTDDERWSAARSAADLPGSVPALKDALLTEENRVVREALFSALARIASPESVEAVLPFLRSDDALTRNEASDALLAMKDAAWPYFPSLLRDPNADVRILACGLLRDMPNEAAVRLCCDVLESEREPNVCGAAVEVLAEVGESSALPVLARCAKRFSDISFLAFSIELAMDRIRSQVSSPRD